VLNLLNRLRVPRLYLAIAVLIVAGAGAFLIWGQAARTKGGAPMVLGPPPPVEVATVSVDAIVRAASAVGTLRSNETVIVRPEVAGRIIKINFDEGASVRKGDPLVMLDDSVNRAEVEQERSRLALAETNFRRAADMAQRGVGTQRTRDEAESALGVARAALSLAEAKLRKMVILAPFSGVVGLRKVSDGDYVNAGQDLVNLESIDPMKVDFRIPEILLPELHTGQTLEIEIDALGGLRVPGKISAIDPLADQAGRSIVIRAVVPNAERRLRPGLYVRVELVLERRVNALLVPEAAIFPAGDQQFVYVLTTDGKVAQTRVKTGLRQAGRVEIVEGLKPDDRIVTAGHMRLRDGIPVTVVPGRK
jgi:membrane fusion protein (multidrug efflux system)